MEAAGRWGTQWAKLISRTMVNLYQIRKSWGVHGWYPGGKGPSPGSLGSIVVCLRWEPLSFMKFFSGLHLEGNQANVGLTSGSPTS